MKYFIDNLPDVMFANVYGCSEGTSSFIYHIIDRNRDYSTGVPIGKAMKNHRVFLMTDDKLTSDGEVGEICLVGSSVAKGYLSNPEKNSVTFVQNPLNSGYPEIMLRTGDLAAKNANGELMFRGRKDSCVKHMGHRIELDEIGVAAASCANSGECVCMYNHEESVICLFYTGSATVKDLTIELRQKLPSYMIPRKFLYQKELPRMFNGKLNLQLLKTLI